MIRQPQYAGSFYPESKRLLEKLVVSLLTSDQKGDKASPLILVTPHAGYHYSGFVAGQGYANLNRPGLKTVILLGVSHHVHFEGVADGDFSSWKTPLGEVSVNLELAHFFRHKMDIVKLMPSPHYMEHSLEVQLPFLQVLTGNKVQIVPLLVGQMTEADKDTFSRFLSSQLSQACVLVVSTDLSHYPRADVSEKVDQATLTAIAIHDVNQFHSVITSQLQEDHTGLVTCACGAEAIDLALRIAQIKDFVGKIIAYQNSAVVTGDHDQVVGYGAVGFYDRL